MIPDPVAEAFGVRTAPQRLPGGEGTSVLAGDLVLKPTIDHDLAEWCQRLAARVDPDALLVPEPVCAADGRWAVDGWTAARFVPGLVSLHEDAEVVAAIDDQVSDAFTTASSGLPPVPPRDDRWARGFEVAMGGDVPMLDAKAGELVDELRRRMDATPDRTHLVHGDLTGNTFRAPDGRVLVLDLSPYVGPLGTGAAIVVADHLLWRDAPVGLAALVDRDLLARALVFRLVSEQLASNPRHGARVDDYTRVVDLLDSGAFDRPRPRLTP